MTDIVNVAPKLPGGPSEPNKPEVVSVEDAKPPVVRSDVSDIGWKEITLTRQDFDMLNYRLNNPTIKVEYVQDEFDRKAGWIFPLLFGAFYTMISFKDEWGISDGVIGIIKFLMFILTYYFISTDKTLRKMGVNYTSQLIIAVCFAALLVAASSVV